MNKGVILPLFISVYIMLLMASDFVLIERKIYFVPDNINLICKVDLESCKAEIIGYIPEGNILSQCSYNKIICWQDNLVLLPSNAGKVCVFSLLTGNCHGISLRGYERYEHKIFQGILQDDIIYMIDCSIPAIFKLNLQTEYSEIIEKPFLALKQKKKNITDICFRSDCVIQDHKLYMASCVDNSVMEFDLITEQVKFLAVGNQDNRYSGIAWNGEYFWLSPRYNTPIVRWKKSGEVQEYPLPYDKKKDSAFLGTVALNNGIFFPGKYNYSLFIPYGTVVNIETIYKGYYFYKKYDNDIVVSLDKAGIWKIEGRINKEFKVDIDVEDMLAFYENKNNIVLVKRNVSETAFLKLNDYIKFIRISKPIQYKNENNIGDKIWQKLKEGSNREIPVRKRMEKSI